MRNRHKKRGVVFLLAITSLSLMMVIGSLFMGMSAQQLARSNRDEQALHALALADAGWNYVYWRQRWAMEDTAGAVKPMTPAAEPAAGYSFVGLKDSSAGGYPATKLSIPGFTEDHAKVWLFERNLSGAAGYQVISLGLYRDGSHMVRTLLSNASTSESAFPPPAPIFNYAIFTNEQFKTSGLTVEGSAGTNTDFIASNGTYIYGNVNAARTASLSGGDILVTGVVEYGSSYKTSGGPAATFQHTGKTYEFPVIDLTYWKTKAQQNNAVYTSGMTFNGGTRSFSSPVVYIQGSLNFSGDTTINGPVTFVVDGSISFKGKLYAGGASPGTTNIALLTTKDISLDGGSYAEAFIYVHNAAGTGKYSSTNTSTVCGSVVADVAGISGSSRVSYRKIATEMPTGAGGTPPPKPTTLCNMSWERLF